VLSPDVRAELLSSVRSMRAWAIVLTMVTGFALLPVALIAGSIVGFQPLLPDYDDGRAYDTQSLTAAAVDEAPRTIKAIENSVRARFGDEVESIEVRRVTLGDDPEYAETPYALTYRLRGGATSVMGLGNGVSDFDFAGLVPGTGRVDSEQDAEGLKALMSEFAAHSSAPMGFSYAYVSYLTDREWDADDTINVGGRSYLKTDLWSVNEGWVPPTDQEPFTDDLPDVRALVFYRDREAGTFIYIGVEPSPVSVYPWEM